MSHGNLCCNAFGPGGCACGPAPVHWRSTSAGRSTSGHARVPTTARSSSKSGVSGSEPGGPWPEHSATQQQQPAASLRFGIFHCGCKHRRSEFVATVAAASAAAAASWLTA